MPARIPAATSIPERRPRVARLELEEVDRRGQSGERRENRVQIARSDEPEPEADHRANEHDGRPLEHDLLHDARARHADRAHHDDLAESFVHRHRDERGDEQEADRETHRAEDQRELAEVAQPLVDLPHRALRWKSRDTRGIARSMRCISVSTLAPSLRAHHEERHAIRRAAALHRLQRRERQCHRALLGRHVEEVRATNDRERPSSGERAKLRIVPGRGRQRVADPARRSPARSRRSPPSRSPPPVLGLRVIS